MHFYFYINYDGCSDFLFKVTSKFILIYFTFLISPFQSSNLCASICTSAFHECVCVKFRKMGIPRDEKMFVIKLRFSQGSTPKIAQTKTMGGH